MDADTSKTFSLGCGLEVLTRGVGKTLVVLLKHADKPIQLIDSPLIGFRRGAKICLLFTNNLTEPHSEVDKGGLFEIHSFLVLMG
jgi:hypothetical protein